MTRSRIVLLALLLFAILGGCWPSTQREEATIATPVLNLKMTRSTWYFGRETYRHNGQHYRKPRKFSSHLRFEVDGQSNPKDWRASTRLNEYAIAVKDGKLYVFFSPKRARQKCYQYQVHEWNGYVWRTPDERPHFGKEEVFTLSWTYDNITYFPFNLFAGKPTNALAGPYSQIEPNAKLSDCSQ